MSNEESGVHDSTVIYIDGEKPLPYIFVAQPESLQHYC
jgi:hypothetical protein